MESPAATELRCSQSSLAAGEHLYATAPRTEFWILIEYHDTIGAKALKDSSLPEPVISHLSQLQKTISHSRLLLIKKINRSPRKKLSAFVCFSAENPPHLYRMDFHNYDELLAIDFPGIFSGSTGEKFEPIQDKLYLVCTNGKRDRCCALWGGAVFKTASNYVGGSVWQSSHVGGHRFAANMICLPHGIYYGRVRPESVTGIIDGYRDQLIDLEHLRGRACYPPEAQAAEYYLLRESPQPRLDAYRLDEIRTISETVRDVQFLSNLDGTRYSIQIRIEPSDREIFESCSKPDVLTRPLRYLLEGWNMP